MDRRPSSAGPPPTGRVTLTLYGPIGELAAALRILADALDREQARSAVACTATVEADAPGPAPGGMTPPSPTGSSISSAQLPSTSWRCYATTPLNSPTRTYKRKPRTDSASAVPRSAGVLTSLAAGRKRLPRDVDCPIKRDAQHRRYRIEPVAAEPLLSAIDRARGTGPPRGWGPADAQSSGSV